MPNVVGVTEMNGPVNLLVIIPSGGAAVTVTRAEAQAWIDSRPNASTAQIETQINNLLTARWVGRADVLAVHMLVRSPVAFTVWVGNPGTSAPANWWL